MFETPTIQPIPRIATATVVGLLALAALGACGSQENPAPAEPTPTTSASTSASPTPSEEPSEELDAWPKDLTPVSAHTLKDPVLEHAFTIKQVLVNPQGLPDPPKGTGWLLAQVEVTPGETTMNEPSCSWIQVSRASSYVPGVSHQVIAAYAEDLNKVDAYEDFGIAPLSAPESGAPVTGWCLYQVKDLNSEKAASDKSKKSDKPSTVDGTQLWMHVRRPAMKDPGNQSYPEYVESSRIRFQTHESTAGAKE